MVLVDRDDVAITHSCTLRFTRVIADTNGNGVVHVTAPDIVVDLGGGTLRGTPEGTPCDQRAGIGIRITAPGVHLINGAVHGFQTAVWGTGVHRGVFRDLDLSENWAQRLRSTPLAEDGADWLWPHDHDEGQWRTRYGAALCLEECTAVEVSRVRVRRGQNGIMLSRVNESRLFDNDCSYVSGWGLSMWRSSNNVICRNAFDFCVRGYSHGVYNRGQDSAGILCFEQCHRNLFAYNSATHGGDGFFCFGGREALGQVPPPSEAADDPHWHRARGCNGNILAYNDFSHAVAHGIELTFSFDNALVGNTCAGAAICGVWGGYSQRTLIQGNRFESCGEGAYGAERGGVNIEHGMDNVIAENTFRDNAVGVRLWWDDDGALLRTPWGQVNVAASARNWIVGNVFAADAVAIELARTMETTLAGNTCVGCEACLVADPESAAGVRDLSGAAESSARAGQVRGANLLPAEVKERLTHLHAELVQRLRDLPGRAQPVRQTDAGMRSSRALRQAPPGRGAILLGPEGPYDWETPREPFDESLRAMLRSYPEGVERLRGWTVRAFATTADPRQDLAAFRAAAQTAPVIEGLPALTLRFGGGSPSTLMAEGAPVLGSAIAQAALPADHFGLVATAAFRLPAGCWLFRLTSDDGVRLTLDGRTYIERWTWHTPTQDTATLTLEHSAVVELAVEYFELTGHAELRLDIERCPPPAAK